MSTNRSSSKFSIESLFRLVVGQPLHCLIMLDCGRAIVKPAGGPIA
jgi:hypothetical protein